MFDFKDNNTMLEFVRRYNEEFLKTGQFGDGVQKIVIKPFFLNTREAVNGNDGKNTAKLYNFDFDLTAKDIKRIAADFGVVTNIIMKQKSNLKNTGEAIIFF